MLPTGAEAAASAPAKPRADETSTPKPDLEEEATRLLNLAVKKLVDGDLSGATADARRAGALDPTMQRKVDDLLERSAANVLLLVVGGDHDREERRLLLLS